MRRSTAAIAALLLAAACAAPRGAAAGAGAAAPPPSWQRAVARAACAGAARGPLLIAATAGEPTPARRPAGAPALALAPGGGAASPGAGAAAAVALANRLVTAAEASLLGGRRGYAVRLQFAGVRAAAAAGCTGGPAPVATGAGGGLLPLLAVFEPSDGTLTLDASLLALLPPPGAPAAGAQAAAGGGRAAAQLAEAALDALGAALSQVGGSCAPRPALSGLPRPPAPPRPGAAPPASHPTAPVPLPLNLTGARRRRGRAARGWRRRRRGAARRARRGRGRRRRDFGLVLHCLRRGARAGVPPYHQLRHWWAAGRRGPGDRAAGADNVAHAAGDLSRATRLKAGRAPARRTPPHSLPLSPPPIAQARPPTWRAKS
jgi:hypothetical protein